MRLSRLLSRSSLVCALFVVTATPAHARMYQWVDAHTGTVQLSGTPPLWYRTAQPGPRVFVFENGRLIDDTARTLSIEESAALRARAFAHTPTSSSALRTPVLSVPAPLPVPTVVAPAPPEDSTSRQIAKFKALLEAYDRAAEEAADDRPAAPTPAP